MLVIALGALFAFLGGASTDAAAGYASIIVDADTGTVLRSRNADTRNYPASLTKLMTLYMLFEAVDRGKYAMATRLPVSKRATRQPPSKIGLKRGQHITVKDAIQALVVKSANDVAVVVAEALGGTEAKFAALMTKKARSLGMTNTTFRNASGLPNRRQLSTARDMSRLGRAMLRDFPHYYHHFKAEKFRYGGKLYRTHNRLLGAYSGMDGMKTGYIRASGFNLIASAKRNGRRIVAVVFGGKTARSRDRHMVTLLDMGFERVAALDKKAGRKLAKVPLPRYKPGTEVPAQKPVTVLATPPEGPWGIQVGAYASITAAEIAIRRATVKEPKLVSAVTALTPFKSSRGRTLYRARFLGLYKSDANAACRTLKASTIPCVIIRNPDYIMDLAQGSR